MAHPQDLMGIKIKKINNQNRDKLRVYLGFNDLKTKETDDEKCRIKNLAI